MTILTIFMVFLRSAWTNYESDSIFNTPWICSVTGGYLHNITAVMGFLITVFGFTKVKIYLTLTTDSTFCMHCSYKLLKAIILIYGAAVLTRILLTDAGPVEIEGMYLCSNPDVSSLETLMIIIIILSFICTNSAFIIIFYKFRNLQHDSIPGLSSQMNSNLFIIPFIFITTVVLAVFTILFAALTKGSNDYSPTYYLYSSIIDNLLNNMVMYWNLFGTFESGDFLDDTFHFDDHLDSGSTSSSRFAMVSEDDYLPPYLWICFPGAHPLKVKSNIVVDNDLEEYIIFEAKRLKQIRRYRRRGFVKSLQCCCESLEEMINELDEMDFDERVNPNNLAE